MRYSLLSFLLIITCLGNAQPIQPVKGIWITNVASDALISETNIQQAVANCKRNGLNSIFVVVWNRGLTMYPSKLLEKYIGIKQDTIYKGFDPIKCIVKEGHKAGLKVFAWFEFGFSYAYKDSNSIWLKKYPDWAGRRTDGSLLVKNGFYWWNSLNPSPQKFMRELVLEVIRQYPVDGIQGDDRLPAMPVEGGYDNYTLRSYASMHHGERPPVDPRDSSFLQWKADQVSIFGNKLYQAVKEQRPSCLVTWAPGPYPWSKQEYLQDWMQWLKGGYADLIIPQLYRYNIEGYERVMKELNARIPASLRYKIFPGMLTSLGDDGYQSSREFTDQMIQLNRKYGFKGEVLFYYETLNRLPGRIYQNIK